MFAVSSLPCQDNFSCILEKLSVKGKEVSTKVEAQPSNYFEALNNNKNFSLRDERAVYINSDDQFSIYQIISHRILNTPHSNLLRSDIPLVLLYDKKNSKCYLIRYSNNDYIYDNISNHKTIITSNYFYNIHSVVLLDTKLNPESFVVFFNMDVDADEKGDFAWGGVLLTCENNFQLFNKANVNINNLTYADLLDILNTNLSEINSIEKKVIKINREKMFSPYEPSFISW